ARIPFVAGLDHHLPRSFARLHPRHGSPTVAIWTQAIIIAAFAFLGQAGTSVRGAYTVVVEMMVVATMLPFVPLFAAAIKLSAGARGGPDSRRTAHGGRDGTDRSGDHAGRDRARVRAACGRRPPGNCRT